MINSLPVEMVKEKGQKPGSCCEYAVEKRVDLSAAEDAEERQVRKQFPVFFHRRADKPEG